MTTPEAPPPTVWPAFRARDARALIRFLVDAFGFEETAVYADGDLVAHAELSWPLGGGVMLGSVRDDGAEGWHVAPGSTGCYVVTDEPDALFERAVAAGAEVLRPLEDTDHGSREFAVRDPEGNLWSFGTYRGEPRRVS
ncbi:VOC family protein [Modestobacter versicolor]|uniref:VOC family protein n=1 Tax=Modestobacter versicolor TaxID=429133 RepID=UPI0034DE4969